MTSSEITSAIHSDRSGPTGRSTRRISGRAVVVGMFAFGTLLTSALYLYWEFHTRPFRALQDAIAAEFPDFTPRVIGGRHKSHRAAALNTLRIVLLVDFNPKAESAASRSEQLVSRLAELAGKHHDVSRYDMLEIHLVHRVPEAEDESWSRGASPADWGLNDGAVTTASPST
jgi:hypothetical protein